MNVGYKHTPYNYKFCNCSWTVLHYQKVHFFFKSTAQQNFLATGLQYACTYVHTSIPPLQYCMNNFVKSHLHHNLSIASNLSWYIYVHTYLIKNVWLA